jgi:hypothetical protein
MYTFAVITVNTRAAPGSEELFLSVLQGLVLAYFKEFFSVETLITIYYYRS